MSRMFSACFHVGVLASVLAVASLEVRAQMMEAEQGILTGTQISASRAGYSGSGYVTGFDNDGDEVKFTFSASAGLYKLYVRYASPSGDKFNFIIVNNENLGSKAFPNTATFVETVIGKVILQQGTNTIRIVKEWGYFDVDYIKIEPTAPANIHAIAENLVTPSPSEEAIDLYALLSKTYGKVVLSGQYGGISELNYIQQHTGKQPAIRGFDLIDYSPSRVAFGASSTETEKAIAWHGNKGITTFAWHWNAPKDLINIEGKEWWRGFYTAATTFDVTKAMNDETSEEYTLIIRDIDAIAVQLKKLKDANVPVLWRPLHEAEGRWFWWGAKGPEPCKWLWHLLFDRLTNHHQLNNLIWVWTSTDSPSALEWYPGDAYVDMIGADIYLTAGNYSSNFITFDNIATLFEGRKIIALSENGTIPDAQRMKDEKAAWSWFATWSGDFILNGTTNTQAHINTVFNHDYVITLDELENIDQILAAIVEEPEEPGVVTNTEDKLGPIKAYPNPLDQQENLTISFPAGQKIEQILLYDRLGRIAFRSKNVCSPTDTIHIDFHSRSSGIYFLKVISSRYTNVFKVMKR